VIISLVAGVLVLAEVGVSVAPILGAAGVVGVAVGFGAQSLVKDYFSGFFLLLENQIRLGDVVEAGGKSGMVEEITLRYVRMRNYDGHVHFVPNGSISTVTSMTRGFAQAVVDVGVAYRESVDQALAVMRSVGAELRADPLSRPRFLTTSRSSASSPGAIRRSSCVAASRSWPSNNGPFAANTCAASKTLSMLPPSRFPIRISPSIPDRPRTAQARPCI
jgi:small-conductance mechanosensitive channel